MQHDFVGDIGDYTKLALLRAVQPGRRLGVAWWLHPAEPGSNNGGHVGYLHKAHHYRHVDPSLFDDLKAGLASGKRHISLLERNLENAVFAADPLAVDGTSAERRAARSSWFGRTVAALEGCDLIFLDPDNGLEPDSFDFGMRSAAKSVALSELDALRRPGRSLVVYHHQTRRPGGHRNEIAAWLARFQRHGFAGIGALRCRTVSPRVYFLLDCDDEIVERARRFAARWPTHLEWHESERACGAGT